MKKILMSILSFAILLGTGAGYIHATQESTPSDGDQTVEIDDATVIRYNENALNGGIDLGIPAKVELTIPFEQPKQYNYSSVASTVMLLKSIGINHTQQELADLLNANNIGMIDGEHLTEVLNHTTEGSRYAFTLEFHDTMNIADLKNHIIEALAYGNPVLVNTVESLGDCYLEGHEQYGTLYQYGLVKDYYNYGETITYTESDYGVFSGFSVNRKVGTTNLSYAAGGKWYVW